VLERFRRRVERVRFFGRVIRATKVARPVRPSQLAEFVKGARKTPVGPHLALMFHAAAHPDKEAIVEYGEHGVRRLTWGELDATINRLAGALVARGVAGGGRVALMLPNGIEYLIAQQALARIGGTAVQIGYRSKAAEIAYILSNADPVVTLVHADFLSTMREGRELAHKAGPMIVIGGDDVTRDAETSDWDLALASASPEVPQRA
jgi:acyl-CoA synthetase (AMP-forming)/AMP-acid ligase II